MRSRSHGGAGLLEARASERDVGIWWGRSAVPDGGQRVLVLLPSGPQRRWRRGAAVICAERRRPRRDGASAGQGPHQASVGVAGQPPARSLMGEVAAARAGTTAGKTAAPIT